MGLFASIWGAQAQNTLAGQKLGGFTPNPEITLAILGTTHAPGSTVEAIVTITGPSVGTYQVTFTNQDTEEEMAAPLELTIGGEPEANSGSAQIVLPDAPGQVTIVASFALNEDDEPVTDSETLTLAVAGTTPGGGTTPPGDGGTDTPPGDGDTTPGGGGTTTPPDGDDDGDTPPAPLPISLTATAISPSKVNLSWSGAATKLYRSTQANFTPGTNTLIAENEASVTTHTDTGLTPQTTYHYILVPNGNPALTQGSASATTPALTAITLTATAEDATTIELSWSGAAGTLYRSTQEGFAIGAETHIARGDAETDATQTSYTDTELTPETTYYYALVPSGNANLTEGRANATTPDLERSAEASFKLLKSNGAEAGDTIGGTVTVVLELELENAEAGSESALVRVQETGSENEVTHDEDEDHIDFSLDLTSEAGWQQWLDPDGEGPQVASWQTATSKPVGTGKWRWNQTWNTAGAALSSGQAGTPQYSQLLNHNGEHTILLAQVDGGAGGTLDFGDESADVEDKNVEVGNLVITNISTNVNEDYFIFNTYSENTEHHQPEIKFTIQDDGDAHQYRWKIYMRPTWMPYDPEWSFPNYPYAYLGATNPTVGEISVNWNGGRHNNNLDEWDQADPDTYTFDIYVEEFVTATDGSTQVIDSAQFRAPYKLKMVDHYVQVNDNIEEDRRMEVGFRIEDSNNQDATSAEVDVLDDRFNLVDNTSLPVQVSVDHGPITAHQFTDSEDGDGWRGIFRAEDASARQNRDHQNRRMLAMNQLLRGRVILWVDSNTVVANTVIDDDYIRQAFQPSNGANGFAKTHFGIRVWVLNRKLNTAHDPFPALIKEATKWQAYRAAVTYESTSGISTQFPGYTEMSRNGTLSKPRRSRFSSDAVEAKVDSNNLRQAVSNVVLHELGHALGIDKTSGDHATKDSPFCVMYGTFSSEFETSLGHGGNPQHFGGRPRTSHAKEHVNAMRKFVGKPPLP